MSKSRVLAFGFVAFREAENEPDYEKNDKEEEKQGEPDWADEEEALEGVGLVEKDDGLGDAVEADRESAGIGEMPV